MKISIFEVANVEGPVGSIDSNKTYFDINRLIIYGQPDGKAQIQQKKSCRAATVL